MDRKIRQVRSMKAFMSNLVGAGDSTADNGVSTILSVSLIVISFIAGIYIM